MTLDMEVSVDAGEATRHRPDGHESDTGEPKLIHYYRPTMHMPGQTSSPGTKAICGHIKQLDNGRKYSSRDPRLCVVCADLARFYR